MRGLREIWFEALNAPSNDRALATKDRRNESRGANCGDTIPSYARGFFEVWSSIGSSADVHVAGRSDRMRPWRVARRRRANASARRARKGAICWRLPAQADVSRQFGRACGVEIDSTHKSAGLNVVVNALNKNEPALARTAALLLRLSDPPTPSAQEGCPQVLWKRLQDSGFVVKNCDEARHPCTGAAPDPGWFAPSDRGEQPKKPTHFRIAQNDDADDDGRRPDLSRAGAEDDGFAAPMRDERLVALDRD